jgi:type III pantothenate kinase
MRLKAMNAYTHKLPLVETPKDEQPPLIGKTTAESLLSGTINGMAFELEGFAQAYKKKFGEVSVVLAGGDAELFAGWFPDWQLAPDLALDGLNMILNFNAKAS